MMERNYGAIDFYLKHPILLDCTFLGIVALANSLLPTIFTITYDINLQLNVISSLIGTSVSLAGFILAALTIIVAFKSNIASKSPQEATNPLELLFSTNNYPKIIKVFKEAIVELTIAFAILYLIWIMVDTWPAPVLLYANIYGAVLMLLTICRTLVVLFLVLDLDAPPK